MKKRETPWEQIGDEVFVRNVPTAIYEADEKYLYRSRILEVKKNEDFSESERDDIADVFTNLIDSLDFVVYGALARMSINSSVEIQKKSNEEIITLVRQELSAHPQLVIKILEK